VVDDTASGELAASLAVDYITNDKISKGAHIALYYPPELLMAPSPVAIFKASPNLEAAKKFVDYLLSQEAQILIAGEGTLSVRTDVKNPEGFMLPNASDALKRAIKIDYLQMMSTKEETIKKFTDTLQGTRRLHASRRDQRPEARDQDRPSADDIHKRRDDPRRDDKKGRDDQKDERRDDQRRDDKRGDDQKRDERRDDQRRDGDDKRRNG
jgi:spermidine/putrescine-binding protein